MTKLENRYTFDVWLRFLIQWEGGVRPSSDETTEGLFLRATRVRAFSNDPLDRGGATMMGVTHKVFTFWRTQYLQRTAPAVEELRMLDFYEWQHIVESLYWEPLKAQLMPFACVAVSMADWHWHSGSIAIRTVQRMLGQVQDGIVGRRTLGAMQTQCHSRSYARDMADQILSRRHQFLMHLMERHPEQKRFYIGWKNRLDALHDLWYHLDLSDDEAERLKERKPAYILTR